MTLKIYEQHVLHHVLPPHSRKAVTEVVADGHAKVHMKCANSHRHAGNPGKRGKDVTKPFGHGWLMVVNPADQRILWAKHMSQPEGNAILEAALMDVIPKFPNLDGVIVDRACSFLPHARHFKVMNQVKYWAVDAFHAQGHTKKCKCNPLYQKRLSLRFKRTNSSAAEQVALRPDMPLRYCIFADFIMKLWSPGAQTTWPLL